MQKIFIRGNYKNKGFVLFDTLISIVAALLLLTTMLFFELTMNKVVLNFEKTILKQIDTHNEYVKEKKYTF